MTTELTEDLLQTALEVRQQAYAPFSQFLVGAALRTKTGEIFSGCNVENRSYGLTNCAERVAIGTAVAAGFREFDTLVIATSGGVVPCGACRQIIWELCGNIPIYICNKKERIKTIESLKLIPYPFSDSYLK